jgi:hypothetical protein
MKKSNLVSCVTKTSYKKGGTESEARYRTRRYSSTPPTSFKLTHSCQKKPKLHTNSLNKLLFLGAFPDFACAKWLGPEIESHFGVFKNKVFCKFFRDFLR